MLAQVVMCLGAARPHSHARRACAFPPAQPVSAPPSPAPTQGFDPSHGPFLHHGVAGMNRYDSVPMEAEALPRATIDVPKGFTWHHGAYMVGTLAPLRTTARAPACARARVWRCELPSFGGGGGGVEALGAAAELPLCMPCGPHGSFACEPSWPLEAA